MRVPLGRINHQPIDYEQTIENDGALFFLSPLPSWRLQNRPRGQPRKGQKFEKYPMCKMEDNV